MAVLPVYNIMAVPDGNIYFKTDYYRTMTGRTPAKDERVILIVMKEARSREDLTEDSFYPVGLMGTIVEVNSDGYLVIHCKDRVNLEEVTVFRDHSIDLSISRRKDIQDLDEESASRRLNALKLRLGKISEKYQWSVMIRSYLSRWDSIGQIACAMSPWMVNTNKERYEILAEDSLELRFEKLEKMLYENLEMNDVKQNAKSAQEQDYQKIYRESAIKKQMDYLQKELDELHPENVTDLRRLELRLEESEMNDTARKEAGKVLGRLKQEGNNSPEYGMLFDYLDYLLSLPWKKEEFQDISLGRADKILSEDHYGLEKVKKRVIQQIAVMNLRRRQSGSILLFVGAPGTGKTSIGQGIARALSREYVRVSLGGVRDEADIRGHRRTYIGSMAGRIMDGIAKSGVSNPVMVLDEIDKLSASYNGDPASALLEVLDPEQNFSFTDHYLNVPYDLSDVFFICTANTIDTIPEPLLNRMEVIQFQGYTPMEKFEIARRHLIPKSREAVGLTGEDVQISDDALRLTISDYTREAGVRGLKKRIDMICRSAAVEFVKMDTEEKERTESEETTPGNAKETENQKSEKPCVSVTVENLRDFLDTRPMHHGLVPEKTNPGIVTGLAWTAAGGEILYMETLFTQGSGKVCVTGQLGDVMKESAQLAVSLVKYIFPEKAELFEKNDLHIHVPDGATPKDGPSAGITLTTAIASLVSGIAVDPAVGMTGEVSLQGNVKPIGGLPEKLMAAQRAGVKRVFIPRENEEDLRDVPKEVLDQMEIIPVEEVEEVLEQLQIRIAAPRLKAV